MVPSRASQAAVGAVAHPKRDAETNLPTAVLALRAELADLAFDLDRRGRRDAADLAAATAARLGELCDAASSATSRE